MTQPQYTICRLSAPADLESIDWSQALLARVEHFHPHGSDHRPTTDVRVLHDDEALYVRFDVQDRYVISRCTQYQDPVWRDSCVEFFAQPRADKGYFNFEINCCGVLLASYIEDPTRLPDGVINKCVRLPIELGSRLTVRSSLTGPIAKEIEADVAWWLEYRLPLAIMEPYLGPLGEVSGQTWRGNFFKCGDKTSHPHWAAWSPIGERLDFHQPDRFGELIFQ